MMQAQTMSGSEDVMQIGKEKVGAKRKVTESSASNKKICKAKLPDQVFLVGKRVQHTFILQKPGRKQSSRTIFTGTVLNIANGSIDPLCALYRIRYDVYTNDDSDDEEIETNFQYDLMDNVNEDLEIIE